MDPRHECQGNYMRQFEMQPFVLQYPLEFLIVSCLPHFTLSLSKSCIPRPTGVSRAGLYLL